MSFGPRRGGRRAIAAAGSRLIADIESFLSGRYEQQLLRNLEAVPAWARLNEFAHGTVEDLAEAVRHTALVSGSPPGGPDRWRSARQVLAIDLLAVVGDDPVALSQLQFTVLVPLELHLMQSEWRDGMTPYELVRITRAALRSILT
jgi:hypothetical protein